MIFLPIAQGVADSSPLAHIGDLAAVLEKKPWFDRRLFYLITFYGADVGRGNRVAMKRESKLLVFIGRFVCGLAAFLHDSRDSSVTARLSR